jgi:hypothetical protein
MQSKMENWQTSGPQHSPGIRVICSHFAIGVAVHLVPPILGNLVEVRDHLCAEVDQRTSQQLAARMTTTTNTSVVEGTQLFRLQHYENKECVPCW